MDSALDNLWILTTTNKNGHKKTGYKLCSLGYYYTVEKPRIELVPTADKILLEMWTTFRKYKKRELSCVIKKRDLLAI